MWTSTEETLKLACQPIYQKAKMKIAWVRNEKTPKANNLLQMAGGKAIKKKQNNMYRGFIGLGFFNRIS